MIYLGSFQGGASGVVYFLLLSLSADKPTMTIIEINHTRSSVLSAVYSVLSALYSV